MYSNLIQGLCKQHVLVLIFIGLLSVGSTILIETVIVSQEKGAEIINIAGRQRMLSQRIGLLASRAALQDKKDNIKAWQTSLDLLHRSHEKLTSHDVLTNSPQQLKQIYFAEERPLDKLVSEFIQLNEKALTKLEYSVAVIPEDIETILEQSEQLLEAFDKVTGIHQLDSEEKSSKLEKYQWITLVLTILVLVLSFRFIFLRLVKRLKVSVDDFVESEERFRSVTHSADISIIVATGETGDIVAWNLAAERSFGHKEEDVIGECLTVLIPERFREQHLQGLKYAYENDDHKLLGKTVELQALHKDGHEFPIELSLGSWKSRGKKYFSAIIHDITDRKKAESEREHLKAQLFTAIESMRDGFALFDKDDKLVLHNSVFVDMYKNHAEAIKIGSTLEEILRNGLDKQSFIEAIGHEEGWLADRLKSHRTPSGPVEQKLSNGRHLLINEHKTADGGIVGIRTDITEKIKFEDSLKRGQKLEAVGQLAGGLAHDFNNLLAIITGNLELLERQIGEDRKSHKKVKTALKAANRGAKLTKQLLGFTRQAPTQVQTVDINRVIKDMSALLDHSLSKMNKLEMTLDEHIPFVDIDPGDFEDCLLNMAVNAKHAMPEGGRFLIETEKVMANLDEEKEDTPYVRICISDEGEGIPKAIKSKIFDPFFTTKEKGKGTGLGLAMVYGFVRRSKGHIKVYSEENTGTSFKIFLPVSEDSVAQNLRKKEHVEIKGGREKILIVDDEIDLLSLAETHLREAGYEVLKATTPDEAISIFENNSDIDLLFSDVVMPGKKNGFDLALEVMHLSPKTRIQLTSGYTSRASQKLVNANIFAKQLYQHILNKPYNRESLLQCIRTKLDEENLIEWTDELVTGNADIDADHKTLVSLLNRYYQLGQNDANDETISSVLNALTDYTVYHFENEERIMEAYNYPHLKNHREVHQMLASYIQNKIKNSQSGYDEELLKFIQNWLLDHIMGMDKDIQRHCNELNL